MAHDYDSYDAAIQEAKSRGFTYISGGGPTFRIYQGPVSGGYYVSKLFQKRGNWHIGADLEFVHDLAPHAHTIDHPRKMTENPRGLVPPGEYDVECTRYRQHVYQQTVRPGTNQQRICGICGAPARFHPRGWMDKHHRGDPNPRLQKPKYKHPATTREGRIERAVFILRDARGTIGSKIAFFKNMNMPDDEITEALNIASGGELVRAALGTSKNPRRSTGRSYYARRHYFDDIFNALVYDFNFTDAKANRALDTYRKDIHAYYNHVPMVPAAKTASVIARYFPG